VVRLLFGAATLVGALGVLSSHVHDHSWEAFPVSRSR